MSLIFLQQVTLYQVGDLANGGSFNNFLDAIDGSYCTFEGGDSKDLKIDGQCPDNIPVASKFLKTAAQWRPPVSFPPATVPTKKT